jgi:hypothetical protein
MVLILVAISRNLELSEAAEGEAASAVEPAERPVGVE